MHLYILTRGIKWAVDRFITELQGKIVPFVFDGEKKVVAVAVRPIQLYEIVFPEPQKDLVLNSLLNKAHGITQYKKHEKWIALIRRLLGAKKIDWNYKTDQVMPTFKDHVEIVGIGTKKDRYTEHGEML